MDALESWKPIPRASGWQHDDDHEVVALNPDIISVLISDYDFQSYIKIPAEVIAHELRRMGWEVVHPDDHEAIADAESHNRGIK